MATPGTRLIRCVAVCRSALNNDDNDDIIDTNDDNDDIVDTNDDDCIPDTDCGTYLCAVIVNTNITTECFSKINVSKRLRQNHQTSWSQVLQSWSHISIR